MKYNLELTDINFLSDGFEVRVSDNSQYFDYSNIESISLLGKNGIGAVCMLLKLKKSKFQEINFFIEKIDFDNGNYRPIRRFNSLCKRLIERTRSEISYQIYPQHSYILLKYGVFSSFAVFSIIGLYVTSAANISVGYAQLVTAIFIGLIYMFKKIEKRLFGKQTITENRIENLDVFITHIFGKN